MKNNTQHIMVDLETMSTSNNASIVSIGAVKFNTNQNVYSEFYTLIDLNSSMGFGFDIDANTISWWMNQSDEARKSLFPEENTRSKLIQDGLLDFSKWLGENKKDIVVWGNGAAFDNVILRNAYSRCNIKCPWNFWNDACYRTIKSMYSRIQSERLGIHHNALDDAKTQANHLLKIFSHINYEI